MKFAIASKISLQNYPVHHSMVKKILFLCAHKTNSKVTKYRVRNQLSDTSSCIHPKCMWIVENSTSLVKMRDEDVRTNKRALLITQNVHLEVQHHAISMREDEPSE